MDITFHISEVDKEKAKAFYESMQNNLFVKRRIEKNLAETIKEVSKKDFWNALVSALLTTQQRSGPNSPISNFLRLNPFPLSIDKCIGESDTKAYIIDELSKFGGIRSYNKIANFLNENLKWIELSGWDETNGYIQLLTSNNTPKNERNAANFLDNNLKGIGPKQSRNLLQMLGLTKYEIPIDSRITKWLNEFGFPMHLKASGLADSSYYELVNDGVIALCNAIEVYPTVFDAVIFSSYDGDEWNDIEDSKW